MPSPNHGTPWLHNDDEAKMFYPASCVTSTGINAIDGKHYALHYSNKTVIVHVWSYSQGLANLE